jgi:N-acyl-D-aspartate/D-glutamate deacylase
MHHHDLRIRNATIVDGSGEERFVGDVTVQDGRISGVGEVSGSAREEIDAKEDLLTPGFVDVHTHYDGQLTWQPTLQPSSLHGVTTVVAGNCGVGFAPCRPSDRDALIRLMEGVEDIPGTALAEGLPWTWETYSEFLDAVDREPHDLDFGVYVPHGPLRLYAMGSRCVAGEPATEDDIATMRVLLEEGIRAGALGFSTSRTLMHRSSDGFSCANCAIGIPTSSFFPISTTTSAKPSSAKRNCSSAPSSARTAACSRC